MNQSKKHNKMMETHNKLLHNTIVYFVSIGVDVYKSIAIFNLYVLNELIKMYGNKITNEYLKIANMRQ